MNILYYIPEPLWLVVLAYLPLEDRKRTRLVCRAWRDWTPFALRIPIEEAINYGRVFCIFAHRDNPCTVSHRLDSEYLDLSRWEYISAKELLDITFKTKFLILPYFCRIIPSAYIGLLKQDPQLEIYFDHNGDKLSLEEYLMDWNHTGALTYLRDNKLGLFKRRIKWEVADILYDRGFQYSDSIRLLEAFYKSLFDE